MREKSDKSKNAWHSRKYVTTELNFFHLQFEVPRVKSRQLFYKNQEVFNNLKRIGKIELPEFEAIMGSEKQFFYRNKMEFSFSNSRWMTEEEIQSEAEIDNANALGFHIPRMWDKI